AVAAQGDGSSGDAAGAAATRDRLAHQAVRMLAARRHGAGCRDGDSFGVAATPAIAAGAAQYAVKIATCAPAAAERLSADTDREVALRGDVVPGFGSDGDRVAVA